MPQNSTVNRRIVLNARPRGLPTAADFRLQADAVPQPEAGQVLLRTLYLSLDPALRQRMGDGALCATAMAIGEGMGGATVSRVEVSRHIDFKAGERVLGHTGWQDYALSNGTGLRSLYPEEPHPAYALGVLGQPGFAAYRALLDIGRPVAGETVVVAAASDAVGSVVGQIAKLKGCRVIGIADGEDRCRYVTDELHFDFCLDQRADDLAGRLAAACPKGIDIYVENIGGARLDAVVDAVFDAMVDALFNAVLPLLNAQARVPVCGLIETCPQRQRIRRQGLRAVEDMGARWTEFAGEMREWVQEDKVKVREDIVFGLENAPEAFIGLLQGKNFGLPVIQLAHE